MSNGPATRNSLLIRLRNAQDNQAWQEFTDIYTPLVLRYCRLRGLQEADAVDVAQEVMFTVSRQIGRFEYRRRAGAFRSWLYKIIRSRYNDYFAARRREPAEMGTDKAEPVIEAHSCPEHDERW